VPKKSGCDNKTSFEYWVPKTSAHSLPPKAAPSGTTSSAPGVDPSPKDLVETHFKVTATCPIGSKKPLAACDGVRKVELLCAALNAGYGSRHAMASLMTPTLIKPVELRRYLRQRLELVSTCIHHDAGRMVAREFFEVVESSEKGAVSFIAGCLGTQLAATRWLEGSGTKLKAFLHVGLYSKATVVPAAVLVKLIKKGGRTPDFLVLDDANQWHLFESKGGSTGARWGQIVDGLRQLDGVSTVGYATRTKHSPRSKVCVQTRLEAGKPLEITAVDPPDGPPDAAEAAGASDPMEIELVPGVWQLLRYLETMEWMDTLTDEIQPDADHAKLWTLAKSTAFGGLVIGVPIGWFKRERLIRSSLVQYMALQDALGQVALEDDGKFASTGPQPTADTLGTRFRRALNVSLSFHSSEERTRLFSIMVGQLQPLTAQLGAQPESLLVAYARVLELEKLCGDLQDDLNDAMKDTSWLPVASKEDGQQRFVLTERGLYVEVI